jgi:hypothetical protein
MHQVKTKDNIRFEEPLSENIQTRVGLKEYVMVESVARDNYISVSELLRNLIREHIHEYATSVNLQKTLHVSNEIDKLVLEKRIISSRFDTNLSKIREILTDFESYLDDNPKKIDYDMVQNYKANVDYIVKLIYENDEFLARKIDLQYRRILKNKHLRGLDSNLQRFL